MSHLNLELRVDPAAPLQFVSTYTNRGPAPLALTFWWNRRLRVLDATGVVIEPSKGPVLPCGVAEDWRVLAPGERHDEVQTLGCTQPAGRPEPIGWAYALAPGTYRVTLVFESPPAHGFSQAAPEGGRERQGLDREGPDGGRDLRRGLGGGQHRITSAGGPCRRAADR